MEKKRKQLLNYIRKEQAYDEFGNPKYIEGQPVYNCYFKAFGGDNSEDVIFPICDLEEGNTAKYGVYSSIQSLSVEHDIIFDNAPSGARAVKVPFSMMNSHYVTLKRDYDRIGEQGGIQILHPNDRMKALYSPKYREYMDYRPLLIYAGRDRSKSNPNCIDDRFGVYYHLFVNAVTGDLSTAVVSEAAGRVEESGMLSDEMRIVGYYGSMEELLDSNNIICRRKRGKIVPLSDDPEQIRDEYNWELLHQDGIDLVSVEAAKKLVFEKYKPLQLKNEKRGIMYLIKSIVHKGVAS